MKSTSVLGYARLSCLVLSALLFLAGCSVIDLNTPSFRTGEVPMPLGPVVHGLLQTIEPYFVHLMLTAFALALAAGVLGTRLVTSVIVFSATSFLLTVLWLAGSVGDFYELETVLLALVSFTAGLLPLGVYLFGYSARAGITAIFRWLHRRRNPVLLVQSGDDGV